ncbi:MAG: universal stress protein [Methyloligellaceae bacterium]
MFNKVLVPIDISQPDAGGALLSAAADRVKRGDTKLMLLTVIGDVPNLVAAQLPADYPATATQQASEQLNALAKSHGLADGSYEVAVRHGAVYHEILSAAEESGADLIAIASHKPDVSDYLLGSVAAKVVRHASCSVLVVRQ